MYAILSALTIVFARPMIVFMAQTPELIDATVSYIRLEAIALVLSTVVRYLTLILLTLVVLVVRLLRREGLRLFASGFSLDWSWLKEWLRTGGLSGLESLVRNAAIVVVLWLASMPVWANFVGGVMGVADPQVIVTLAVVSIGFYILFAFNNVEDSVFYGRGRTDLMLYQSLIVNTLFYGGAYILYRAGVFTPTLVGIAIMFGLGIAMDSLITFVMFARFRSRLAIPS